MRYGDFGNAAAAAECVDSQPGDTGRNHNVTQVATFIERIGFDDSQILGQINLGQVVATIKCSPADFCDRLWKVDRCQTTAIIEGFGAYFSDSIGRAVVSDCRGDGDQAAVGAAVLVVTGNLDGILARDVVIDVIVLKIIILLQDGGEVLPGVGCLIGTQAPLGHDERDATVFDRASKSIGAGRGWRGGKAGNTS